MSTIRPGSNEKRDYLRMSLETEISCKIRGKNVSFTGQCKNLSHTGIQFTTSQLLKEGDELDITVKIAGILPQPPLQAELNVKRVEKNKDSGYTVSGVLKNVV